METTTTNTNSVITTDNNTTTISLSFNNDELWLAITGSGFANTNYWISDIELDSWSNPCNITITHEAQFGNDYVTNVVTPQQLYKAFGELVVKKQTHCGGYAINDLDNADSCFADLVVQQALFGEIVFG